MSRFEYKIVPAPNRGLKSKGVKGAEARFANALEDKMNVLAADGWEYQRAETLPSVERSGLASTTTEWRNVLVFRRLRENDAAPAKPELLPAPLPEKEAVVEVKEDTGKKAPEPPVTKKDAADKPKGTASEKTPEKAGKTPSDLEDDLADNGVEDTGDVSMISSSLGKLAAARKLSKSDS